MSMNMSLNRKLCAWLLSLMIAVCPILLWGCDAANQASPFETNTHWLSEEPYLSIKATVRFSNLRKWTHSQQGTMIWDDEEIAVYVEVEADAFSVSSAATQEEKPATLLFAGSWGYDENSLVFHIDTDNLMSGKYKEIRLRPVGIAMNEPKLVSLKYPYEINSSWCSIDPFFTIHQQNHEGEWRAFGDMLIWDGKSIGITTVMIGSKYYVVSLSQMVEEGYPEILFSGTWEYREDDLILNVETDNLMGGSYQTIVMKTFGESLMES